VFPLPPSGSTIALAPLPTRHKVLDGGGGEGVLDESIGEDKSCFSSDEMVGERLMESDSVVVLSSMQSILWW